MGIYALEAVQLAQTEEQQKYAYDHAVAGECSVLPIALPRVPTVNGLRTDDRYAVEKVVAQVQEMKMNPNAIFTTWSSDGDIKFSLQPPPRVDDENERTFRSELSALLLLKKQQLPSPSRTKNEKNFRSSM